MGLFQYIFMILAIVIIETITNATSTTYRHYRRVPHSTYYRHYRGAPYSVRYGDNDILKQPYDNAHGVDGPSADILFSYKNPDAAVKNEASIIIDSKDANQASYLQDSYSKCKVFSTGKKYSIGEEWYSDTKCTKHVCKLGEHNVPVIHTFGCGRLTLQPNCQFVKGKGPTYPSCCPSLFCTGKYQGPTLAGSGNK